MKKVHIEAEFSYKSGVFSSKSTRVAKKPELVGIIGGTSFFLSAFGAKAQARRSLD
jgi:hypothetical protein